MVERVRSEQPEGRGQPTSEVTWKGIWEFLGHSWDWLSNATSSPGVIAGAMVAILLLAGVLRLTGLNWDENQHLHPDERCLTMVENSLEWPKSLTEYFDTAVNPLNPYNRGHGT